MKFKKVNKNSWDFQKNKEITGKLLAIEDEVGKFKTKNYIIETEDGIEKVFGSKVLDLKIEAIAKIGNFVKIVFLGLIQPKNGGQEYKDWEIFLGIEE